MVAGRRLALAGAVLLIAGTLSCSDDIRPLNYDGVSGQFSTPTETLLGAAVVVADSAFAYPAATGDGGSLMIGHVLRSGASPEGLAARSYFQWDFAELEDWEVREVRAVSLNLHIAELDQWRTAAPSQYALTLHEVTSAWEEDSLGLTAAPAYAAEPLGADTLDLFAYPNTGLFETEEALRTLVSGWLGDSLANHGLVLCGDPTVSGLVRLISSEGNASTTTSGSTTAIYPRALTIEVRADATDGSATDSIFTINALASADGFVTTTSGAGGDGATGLTISSGMVQRLAVAIDLAPFFGGAEAEFPIPVAIHEAFLRLRIIPGAPWSLAADEQITLYVGELDANWPAEALPSQTDMLLTAVRTVGGSDPMIRLDITAPLQRMIESDGRGTLIVRAASEASEFLWVQVEGVESGLAGACPPQLQMSYSRLELGP